MTESPRPTRFPAPRRGHLLAAAIIMTLLVIYGSFVPMQFKAMPWAEAVRRFEDVPYLKLGMYRRADYVANLLLFVPLGFLWIGAVDLDRRKRLGSALAVPIIAGTLIGLAVAIEFFQLWSLRRTVSQNDMYAESAGAIIGILLWFVIGRWLCSRVRDFNAPSPDTSPVRRLLQLYVLGFLVYCAQPLDITFSPEEISRKFLDTVTTKEGITYEGRIVEASAQGVRIELKRGDRWLPILVTQDRVDSITGRRILLRPFAHGFGGVFDAAWGIGSDLLLFIPIGMLLRIGRSRTRTILYATILAFLLAAGIEVMQIFIFSRYVDTTDILTSGLGGFIGALLIGPLYLQRNSSTRRAGEEGGHLGAALLLCAAYCIPLALVLWAPFKFVHSFERFITHLAAAIDIPFKAYYFTSEFKALSYLLRGFMLFLPVGAMLRWGWGNDERDRAGGRVLVITVALVLGVGFEVGQAATVRQTADITDVMVYLVGALAGWWMWARLTQEPTQVPPRDQI
ncbi:MAG: VanZ family protein [Phycisphaeraceae bacterium]